MEAGVWVIYEEQGIRHGPERGMCTVMNTLGNRRLGGGGGASGVRKIHQMSPMNHHLVNRYAITIGTNCFDVFLWCHT